MSDRFAVEADRKLVGIAVRVPGGFRFFSSDPDYASLEARTFPRVRSMIRRATQLARRRRSAARGTASDLALR